LFSLFAYLFDFGFCVSARFFFFFFHLFFFFIFIPFFAICSLPAVLIANYPDHARDSLLPKYIALFTHGALGPFMSQDEPSTSPLSRLAFRPCDTASPLRMKYCIDAS
jgi:hypothetical protein